MTLPDGYDGDPAVIIAAFVAVAFLGFMVGVLLVAISVIGRPRGS